MRKGRVRILYLAPAWPHGRSFGKQLRLFHLGHALQKIGEVHWVIACDDHDAEVEERTRREFNVAHSVSTEQLPLRKLRDRLGWWFDARYQDPSGSVAKAPDRVRLIESLGGFDLIWINSVRAANMFGLWHWPRSVLDIDDIPSTYELTKFRSERRLIDRVKAGARVLTWRRREKLLQQRFTILGVCSQADRQYLGGGSRIHVIPNGFERPRVKPNGRLADPPRLGFIGLLSYWPNLHGVQWFVEQCWPRIKKAIPGARLRLVGKGTDGPLQPLGLDVEGLGWIEDPSEEMATWSGMIVPVHLGSGTRIKIAEAFSRNCPLVSTRLGARGYECENGNELLLADTPGAFAQACINVIRRPFEAEAMAQRAWLRFLREWTWDAVGARVRAAAEHCLQLEPDLSTGRLRRDPALNLPD